jgi:GntR family transcriptional regulator
MSDLRRPVAQPLHEQIKLLLLERIEAGDWPPGTYLPAESRLAEDYGVSVGTLRTALTALAHDGILVRRQGKGTAVATHDADSALFRFFTLQRPDGSRVLPVSQPLARTRRAATPEEAADLGLAPGAEVVHIRRLREIDGRTVIFEDIALDAARFGPLASVPEVLPNTLYHLYQKDFGATVAAAEERLAALPADPDAPPSRRRRGHAAPAHPSHRPRLAGRPPRAPAFPRPDGRTRLHGPTLTPARPSYRQNPGEQCLGRGGGERPAGPRERARANQDSVRAPARSFRPQLRPPGGTQ